MEELEERVRLVGAGTAAAEVGAHDRSKQSSHERYGSVSATRRAAAVALARLAASRRTRLLPGAGPRG